MLANIFTANRLVAAVTLLTGLAAFVAGAAHVLPGSWPNYALAASGLITHIATALKFLEGSQKFDQLTHAQTPGALLSDVLVDLGAIDSPHQPESAVTPDPPQVA